MITLWIPGQPRTKGSLDAFHQDTPESKRWRSLMAYALRYAKDGRGSDVARMAPGVPVAVRGVFWLPVADVTTPNCGDLDKLLRNLLDAGTDAQTYADDVQVVRTFVDKVPCTAGEGPGLLVTIWAPTPEELYTWYVQASYQRTVAMEAQGLT